MKYIAVTILILSTFFLRLSSNLMYDPIISPCDQDYIFNMKELAEFTGWLAFWLLTTTTENVFTTTIVRPLVSLIMLSYGFSAIREIAGGCNQAPLTIIESIFYIVSLCASVITTIIRLLSWEKKKKKWKT